MHHDSESIENGRTNAMRNEPRDVQFGDPELVKPQLAEESVPFDLCQIKRYQREQGAKGQCEIGVYVRTIHCAGLATTLFGHGSIIKVCDTHGKWNPFMVDGGKCPDCGELADHYPCKMEETVMLQDEEDAIAGTRKRGHEETHC